MAKKQPDINKAKAQLNRAVAKSGKKPVVKKPGRKPKTQATKIDWTEAQKFYLLDATVTQEQVAKKFGVSRKAVQLASERMGWQELRNKLSETSTNMMLKALAKKKVAANDRHVSNYKTLEDKIMLAVAKLSDESDPGEMLALAKALKTASDGERVALGLPTMVNSIADKDGNDFATAFADAWVNARRLLNGDSGTQT